MKAGAALRWLIRVFTACCLAHAAAGAPYDSANKPSDSELKILRVTPEGHEVPAPGRQIVITFDRPVVALGAMTLRSEDSPVSVAPKVSCQWHWLDPRSLGCELNEAQALAPATSYTLTVASGLKAQDGATLKKDYRWSFTTERPAIRYYSFEEWRSPGTPVVRLVFNQPVTKDSVEARLHFAGEAGVIANPDPYDRAVYYVLPLPGESASLLIPGGTAPVKSDEQRVAPSASTPVEARRVWLLSPLRELPLDSTIRLTVVPGLRSYAGPLLGEERRTVVQFDTYPSFQFLGVRCLEQTTSVLIPALPSSAAPECNPFGRVSLVFSAPVIPAELKEHLLLEPDLLNGRKDYDPWQNDYVRSHLGAPHRRGAEYSVDLPEHLRAFQHYSIVSLRGVRDEFGRPLRGITSMQFRTAHRPARLKVSHPIAVLEKDAPTSMPLYVTNLTDIDIQYGKLTPSGGASELSAHQSIDPAWDIAYATPARIRELLQGQSGIVTGTLIAHPTPLDTPGYRYFDEADYDPGMPGGRADRDFLAEVTPFQVQAKLGAYNTLVWVTSLARGTPVAQARVRIFRSTYQGLAGPQEDLAEAITDRDGVALLPGRQVLEPQASAAFVRQEVLMVRVDSHKDMALLPLDGSFAIDTYRASRGAFWSGFDAQQHVHAWGTTAQGVYKLGDTVQYKLYVREQGNLTLTPVAQRSGYQLSIIDPTGNVVKTESDVTLNEFGAYAGSFRAPPSGAVGWYEFNLQGPATDAATNAAPRSTRASWIPMRVLIADFTPAPFQVSNTLDRQFYQPGDTVDVASQALLHAGGPYANAAARVTARLFPQELEVSTPVAAGFNFASFMPPADCGPMAGRPEIETIHQSEANTGDKGEFTTRFELTESEMWNARLEVESAVRDERGKYVAQRSEAEFHGLDRFVGVRADRWTFEQGKPASIQYLVVDDKGKVVPDTPVTVSIEGEVVNAARVKGAGSAYLTSYDAEWLPDGTCTGSSGKAGIACSFVPHHPGLYSITASVHDSKGRAHRTELCTWVIGQGRVLWEEPADMSLTLIPEKMTYKVGEHARYLVKNPFPGAQALVTIERAGVIKHWVQPLPGNTPIIDFAVEPDFVPGFYLSVVVMSPRVAPVPGASTLDKDGVDLGRPTYRIGYLSVAVTDPYKALDVRIKSDRPSYKPRDTVKLRLAAVPHAPSGPRQPVEFAVAVLDEAVFDLIQDGKQYFDPYRGLYRLEALDLSNYSLLTRLIGLQKFEKKGANSGGDGGAGFDMRSISQYVAYWNPSVKADAHGRAALAFQLPDNLTGWRVFAIAVTPGDRVGLGDYKFKSSKLTELRPVLPNQLTSGDRFKAGFSVLNRADKTRTIDVELTARGPIASGETRTHRTVTLAPFKRETVWLDVSTLSDGSVNLTAIASDRLDKDALVQSLAVHQRVSLDVAASYGTTLMSQIDEPIAFPPQMLPGVGEVSVVFSPSVIGNLDGAMRYVRDYPYLCWEQRLTKALMAANYLGLRAYLGADVTWPEAKALPQKMLDDAASFQAPSGGMDFWAPDDSRVSPYLSAATALAFNRLRAAGYAVPEEVDQRLDRYLQTLLRTNTAPTFYSEGMVSSVRAVALEALAERKRLALADLHRYESSAARMDLFGLAAYLDAATRVPGAEDLARSLAGQILAHANQSGGQFHFSETWDDGYYQLLGTPLRSNCAILSALLDYAATEQGAALTGDIPFKLVRMITQARGSRDHWENTQENVYCSAALARYAAVYEQQPPALQARASLDASPIGSVSFKAYRDPPAIIRRPNGADAGHHAVVHIEREGSGRLYYSTRLSYSLTEQAATETNAGIEVHREYSVQRDGVWKLLSPALSVKRGELLRVDLYVSLPAPRHFVVVDDPVPGGLEPVNRELATASTVDADEAEFQASGGAFWFKYSDWSEYGVQLWSFYHRELTHTAARFYADYLPAGHYHLSYAAQAMAEGEFSASPTRAEEMYDPDVYGKGLPAHLSVAAE